MIWLLFYMDESGSSMCVQCFLINENGFNECFVSDFSAVMELNEWVVVVAALSLYPYWFASEVVTDSNEIIID